MTGVEVRWRDALWRDATPSCSPKDAVSGVVWDNDLDLATLEGQPTPTPAPPSAAVRLPVPAGTGWFGSVDGLKHLDDWLEDVDKQVVTSF